MNFDEILEQILTLLKRQGRISYSALRRRLDLDDAYLEDLKDELFFSHPVVDEDGRGLVWTGEAEATAYQPLKPTRLNLSLLYSQKTNPSKLNLHQANHPPQTPNAASLP